MRRIGRPFREHLHHRIGAQRVVIIEVFITQRDPVDALRQQRLHVVNDLVGVARIGDAARQRQGVDTEDARPRGDRGGPLQLHPLPAGQAAGTPNQQRDRGELLIELGVSMKEISMLGELFAVIRGQNHAHALREACVPQVVEKLPDLAKGKAKLFGAADEANPLDCGHRIDPV